MSDAVAPTSRPSPGAPGGPVYERRHPEDTTLHKVVRDNLRTLYAAVEDGYACAPLPAFVRAELEGYLDCGVLCRGFALMACPGCPERHLVAFSCKRRGFCPSCLGRRMAQTTANLLDHVLPQTPLRQWVLTVPHALRTRLAYDRVLLARVGRLFVATVLGFYRRRLGDLRVHPGRGQSGAVTVVQRTSADLKLNPHLDSVFLDGVYAPGADGKPVFHALPRLSTSDVADVLQAARARILGDLRRRGVVVMDDDSENPLVEDDGFSDRESALAHLAAAAVSGAPPAGPERRSRPPIPLRGHPGVAVTAPLTVTEMGFSLHAATHAGAHDARAREALVKYILRPPIAQERLRLLPDDLVRIVLRRPFRDGTTAIDLDPLSLLSRLAAAVPPPRQHGIRYAGVLAAASKWRAQVVPPPLPSPAAEPDPQGELPQRPSPPPTWRCRYRPWAELLRRAFAIDVTTCPRCGGPLRLLALVKDPGGVARYLRHLGEPTEPPPRSPARAPPYWKSRAFRRRVAEPPSLLEE